MKFSRNNLLGLLLLAAPSSASAFVTSFPLSVFAPLEQIDDPPAPMTNDVGAQIAGKDGWTINDPDYNVTDTRGLSYSNFLNSSLGAQVGGYYAVPVANSSIYLSHAATVGLQSSSFDVDFAIQASNEANPGRDAFGFSFRGASNENLLTISFVPYTSPTYPLDDAYQVRYTVGALGTVNAQDGNGDPMFMFHNGFYSLELDFTPNGANPTFSATLTGSNPQTFSGTATGLGASSIARVGAEWNLVGDGGNNGLIFDNISLVPEPSSSLLICLAGLGFVSRRKRN